MLPARRVLGRWTPYAALAFALLALAACSGPTKVAHLASADRGPEEVTVSRAAQASVLVSSNPDEVPEVETVEISPEAVVVDVNDWVRLSASALDASGEPVEDVGFIWTIVDPRAGSVTSDGVLMSRNNPGEYEAGVSVTAIQNTPRGVKHVSATAPVAVVGRRNPSHLTSVSVLPGNPTVLSRQIYRLRAAGFDQNGRLISSVGFDWKVNDPALGHINEIGYLTVEGEAGLYEDAVTVTGVWRDREVSETADVTVIDASGEGDFIRVQVLPQRIRLFSGDRVQLHAVVLDGYGELVQGAQVRWSLMDERVGTVSGRDELVAGDSPGVYTEAVRAEAVYMTDDGVVRAENYASVVVRRSPPPRRLEVVRVFPETVKAPAGGRVLVLAQATNNAGRPSDNVTRSWEVTREDVGAINDNGQFTASGAPGIYPDGLRVTLRQQVDGETITMSKSVDVIITGELAEVEVQPSMTTIVPGSTVRFTATGRDANGHVIAGLVKLWSVTDDDVGTIDAFGNFTAGEEPGMFQKAVEVTVIQSILAGR